MKNRPSQNSSINIGKQFPLLKLIIILIAAGRLSVADLFAKTNEADSSKINIEETTEIDSVITYKKSDIIKIAMEWIEKARISDDFIQVAFDLEQQMLDLPDSTVTQAEQNYELLFQKIQENISKEAPIEEKYMHIQVAFCGTPMTEGDPLVFQDSNLVKKLDDLLQKSDTKNIERLYMFLTIARTIRYFKTDNDNDDDNHYTPIGFLTNSSIEDWESICTPATTLMLSYADKLGINDLRIGITTNHVFIYDKATEFCIDLSSFFLLKDKEEASKIMEVDGFNATTYKHDGIYTMPKKNILGVIANNIKVNVPKTSKKLVNKFLLKELSYMLYYPIELFNTAKFDVKHGDNNENIALKKQHYNKAINELMGLAKSPYNYWAIQVEIINTYYKLANIQTDTNQKILYLRKALYHLQNIETKNDNFASSINQTMDKLTKSPDYKENLEDIDEYIEQLEKTMPEMTEPRD